jgi:parvulin-like peptidyl-prolyl isomerase
MRFAALTLICAVAMMSVASCSFIESNQDSNSESSVSNVQSPDEEAAANEAVGAQEATQQQAAEAPSAGDEGTTPDEGAAADEADAGAETGGGQDDAEQLAAMVNGTPIPLGEFQRQAFDTQRFYVEQGVDPNSEEGQKQLLYLRRQVLNDMINQVLVESAASDLGITASDEELEQRLQMYYDKYGTGEELESALEERGTTLEQIKAMERSQIIGQKMMMDVITKDVPTTARFVHARHILCNSREDCEAALARIEAGEAFEDVAREVSQDAASAEPGGDLDWITIGMLPSQQLEQEIFKVPVGGRSPVVLTDFGYHIIEVLDEDDARELSEEQRYTLREKAYIDWLAEQRAASDIEIYIEDLKNLE